VKQVQEALAAVVNDFGKIDVFVANAGKAENCHVSAIVD
jgi:NADP-dependent 3-hydroxy acid dehydrogenase YdfG